MSDPIPVILCGKTTQIGTGVIAGLKPEYEVTHFIQSTATACLEIPLLFASKPLPSASTQDNIGSKNYHLVPRAIILGQAFKDEDIDEMRDACKSVQGAEKVPWLRLDLTKPTPPLGPEYGKHMVGRVKDVLGELKLGEGGGEEKGGIVWY